MIFFLGIRLCEIFSVADHLGIGYEKPLRLRFTSFDCTVRSLIYREPLPWKPRIDWVVLRAGPGVIMVYWFFWTILTPFKMHISHGFLRILPAIWTHLSFRSTSLWRAMLLWPQLFCTGPEEVEFAGSVIKNDFHQVHSEQLLKCLSNEYNSSCLLWDTILLIFRTISSCF